MLLFALFGPAYAQAGSHGDSQWSSNPNGVGETGSGTASAHSVYQGKIRDGTSYPWESYGTDNNILGDLYDNRQVHWLAASDQGIASSSIVDGAITDTRHWIGTGPPPLTITVLEVSSVSSIGGYENGGNGTATAKDAFNDPMTPCSFAGNGMGVQSTGSRFVQVNSSSGTVTLSGHVNGTASTPASTGSASQGWCNTYGSFNWYATDLQMTLSGTTQDSNGNQNILVGQGCTASLTGIPSGCTISNYSWSVSGTTL